MKKSIIFLLAIIYTCLWTSGAVVTDNEIEVLCRNIISDSISAEKRIDDCLRTADIVLADSNYIALAGILEAVNMAKSISSNEILAENAREWTDFIYRRASSKLGSDNNSEVADALSALAVIGNSPFTSPRMGINANIMLANMAYNDKDAEAMEIYVEAVDSVANLLPQGAALTSAQTQLRSRLENLRKTSSALKQRLSGLWYSTDFGGSNCPVLELIIDADSAKVKESNEFYIPFGTAVKNDKGEWYLPDGVSKNTVYSPSKKEATYVFSFDSDNPGSPKTALFMSIFAEKASGNLMRSMVYKQSKSKKYNYGAALTGFGGEILGMVMQAWARKQAIKTNLAGVTSITMREIVPGVARAYITVDLHAENSEGRLQNNCDYIEMNLFKVDTTLTYYGFLGEGSIPKKLSYNFNKGEITYAQATFSPNELYHAYKRKGEAKLPPKREKEAIDSLVKVYSKQLSAKELDGIKQNPNVIYEKRAFINGCKFKLLHKAMMSRLDLSDSTQLTADDRDELCRAMSLHLDGRDFTSVPITIKLDGEVDYVEFTGKYAAATGTYYVSLKNPRHYLELRKKYGTTTMEEEPERYFGYTRKEEREKQYTEKVLPIEGRAEWYTYPDKKEVIHVYIGTFKDRKFEGKGTLTEGGREIYSGDWKEGKYHGQGRLNVYDKYGNFVRTDEGVFEKGKLKTK